ncbi:hypothetical protein WI664_00215 [Vibrio cholerae]
MLGNFRRTRRSWGYGFWARCPYSLQLSLVLLQAMVYHLFFGDDMMTMCLHLRRGKLSPDKRPAKRRRPLLVIAGIAGVP